MELVDRVLACEPPFEGLAGTLPHGPKIGLVVELA